MTRWSQDSGLKVSNTAKIQPGSLSVQSGLNKRFYACLCEPEMYGIPIALLTLIVINMCLHIFLSHAIGRGYKIGPSCVSVCACPLMNTLTAEMFDVGTQNLVWGLSLKISHLSSMVIGQRSRSLD